MTTNTNNNNRANKLVVKTNDGHLQADFFRTHKHIATICDNETGYTPDTSATKSAIREGFRKYMADNAEAYGVTYDPTDHRTEQNVRKATYATEADVAEDAIDMVASDITTFISKMPHADMVDDHQITIESLTPKTKTSKGTDLAMMGIEDGKYVSNGNLAWFDIEGMVTMSCHGTEIYQTISMELVSGQLKKFRMTQTQWNTETTKSMIEAGLIKEEVKAEKSAKAEETKVEDPKSTKKTRKSKKNTEKVED